MNITKLLLMVYLIKNVKKSKDYIFFGKKLSN